MRWGRRDVSPELLPLSANSSASSSRSPRPPRCRSPPALRPLLRSAGSLPSTPARSPPSRITRPGSAWPGPRPGSCDAALKELISGVHQANFRVHGGEEGLARAAPAGPHGGPVHRRAAHAQARAGRHGPRQTGGHHGAGRERETSPGPRGPRLRRHRSDWYCHRRLHGERGHIPPAEYETSYYRETPGHSQNLESRSNPERFTPAG